MRYITAQPVISLLGEELRNILDIEVIVSGRAAAALCARARDSGMSPEALVASLLGRGLTHGEPTRPARRHSLSLVLTLLAVAIVPSAWLIAGGPGVSRDAATTMAADGIVSELLARFSGRAASPSDIDYLLTVWDRLQLRHSLPAAPADALSLRGARRFVVNCLVVVASDDLVWFFDDLAHDADPVLRRTAALVVGRLRHASPPTPK